MKKRWWILIAIASIIIVVFAIIFRATADVKTGLQFYLAPDNVSVSIDGQKSFVVSYGSKTKIAPGEYSLEFSSDGFESTTQKFTVTDNQLTPIYLSLTPISDEAKSIMQTEDMQLRGDRAGGYENSVESTKLEEDYPFIDKLPIYAEYYTVAPCNDGDTVVICVSLYMDNETQRQNAVDDMKNAGIDTSSVKIIYKDI